MFCLLRSERSWNSIFFRQDWPLIWLVHWLACRRIVRLTMEWYWLWKRNAFCKTNGAESLSKWQFRGTNRLSQKQNFCADNSGSVLLVDTAEKEKAAGFSVLDYWEKQTGRTENDAVSVSENPETLWYPEGSISSASTHLCHRLYCPWVWCKDAEWIARTRWCQYYAESICAFFYADEAGICKATAIDGIIFRRQKIVWKMQKVSETAWLFRLEWSMGGFYETKMLPFF